jgi:gliding motility-associated-like protein
MFFHSFLQYAPGHTAKIKIFVLICLYGLFYNNSQAQRIGIEYNEGIIDTMLVRFSLSPVYLCQGKCYQFYYLEQPYRSPDVIYYEDSVRWYFEAIAASPTDFIYERNPLVCFPDLSGPDTITLQQYRYSHLSRRSVWSGEGHRHVYVIKCPPEARFDADKRVVCTGETVNYRDVSQLVPDRWIWTFEGGNPANWDGVDPPPVTYAQAGFYTTTLVVSNSAGQDSIAQVSYIEVVDAPKVISDRSLQIRQAYGDWVSLQSCATGDQYNWVPDDGLSCSDCPNPQLLVGHTTHYQVHVSLDEGECTEVCDIHLLIDPVDERVYFPTAFSPNKDGINDEFLGHNYNTVIQELAIFDRWGNQVFFTKDNQPWDGNHNGQELQPGTYIYYAIIDKLYSQETIIVHGEVILLR